MCRDGVEWEGINAHSLLIAKQHGTGFSVKVEQETNRMREAEYNGRSQVVQSLKHTQTLFLLVYDGLEDAVCSRQTDRARVSGGGMGSGVRDPLRIS